MSARVSSNLDRHEDTLQLNKLSIFYSLFVFLPFCTRFIYHYIIFLFIIIILFLSSPFCSSSINPYSSSPSLTSLFLFPFISFAFPFSSLSLLLRLLQILPISLFLPFLLLPLPPTSLLPLFFLPPSSPFPFSLLFLLFRFLIIIIIINIRFLLLRRLLHLGKTGVVAPGRFHAPCSDVRWVQRDRVTRG